MKLRIGYFYPNELNLYGDNGNVEILLYRAKVRGFDAEVVKIDSTTSADVLLTKSLNLVFMGGGPDSGQKEMYLDLTKNKKSFLKDFMDGDGVGLFVCGSYQLLGNYYKAANGAVLEGLGVFDIYTEHFGNHKPRCIGNIVCEISSELRHDPVFNSVNRVGTTLVGFENHGGRTYLGKSMVPFGKVLTGDGNNSEDKTEGALYKNFIGTYLHGPALSKNPHLADYLIAKALRLDALALLNDEDVVSAHNASKKFRR